jgi:hypothetical protein
MKKHLVSAVLLKLAAKKAEAIMEASRDTRENWLDQCRTSAASKAAGGMVLLETEYDWVPAFFVWYHGGARDLPRDLS